MLIGIIGKANVGKSTFFNAATELSAQAANYPFTTIRPNLGVSYARVKCVCREFGVQDNPLHSMCVDGNRFIPIKLIDVAGLVPGAHNGRGLGNKFLDDARQADVLIHVVDASASTDSEGKSVPAGFGDPLYDVKFVEDEFDLWMASVISRDWNKVAREAENQAQKLENMISKRLTGLGIDEAHIVKALEDTGLRTKKATLWNEEDIFNFCKKVRSRAKPIVIAANKSDLQTAETIIIKLKNLGLDVIPCIAEAEILLRRATKKGFLHYLPGDSSFTIKSGVVLSEQQKKALDTIHSLIAKYGSTGVQEVINLACFKLLKLIVVYPVQDEMKLMDKRGNVLPDAYLLPEGSTAKDLAVTIHADIGKGFLHAIDARTKQRLGAEHKLKNNDVIKIVSATSNG
ncbi:MAG TPA: redox-regulated ATPase YchF [Nitrososphaeraceae archaeon]|nr:redox-regulated ATPase YchF [Nitrososphaeraceae archaeon]